MKTEPQFLLESISRWDLDWRLSQTEGRPILLPVPQDFHTPVEAMQQVKRLSGESGCSVLVVVTPDSSPGPPSGKRVITISQTGATTIA